MHRTRCPDLTYPGGSEKKHASWGLKGTRKQGELVPLAGAEGQGAPRSKDSFKEGKGVKQALRTEDAAGTVCKVEIKWSHWKSWMGSTWTDFTPRTEKSLKGLNQRETQSHLFL